LKYETCKVINRVPDPPKKPKYGPRTRKNFNELGDVYIRVGTGAKVCAYIAARAKLPWVTAACEVGGMTIEWIGERYKEAAKDPPSRDYETIWVPRKLPSSTGLPNIPKRKPYTEDLFAIWRIVMSRVPVAVALTGFTTSVDRAAGAQSSGAAEHEARQLQASYMYARAAAKALADSAPIVRDAAQRLREGPLGSIIVTFEDFQEAERLGALGGFDPGTVKAMRGLVPLPVEPTLAAAADVFSNTPLTPADFGKSVADYISLAGYEASESLAAQALATYGTGFA
jgi:hypothetical protein